MPLPVSHLRRGELIAATAAVVLLVLLFVLPWFRSPQAAPHNAALDGWTSLPVLRWLILASVLAGLLLAVFQQTRQAPALPVVMSVIVTALAALTTIVLVVRLPTSADTPQLGAYLGVLGAAALATGGFVSLREEDGSEPGPDHPIERVSLPGAPPVDQRTETGDRI